jgi:hypothetical protein
MPETRPAESGVQIDARFNDGTDPEYAKARDA